MAGVTYLQIILLQHLLHSCNCSTGAGGVGICTLAMQGLALPAKALLVPLQPATGSTELGISRDGALTLQSLEQLHRLGSDNDVRDAPAVGQYLHAHTS